MVNRICSQQSVKIKSNTEKSVNTAMFYKCTSIHSKVRGGNYFADGWRCGVRIVHLCFQYLYSSSILCRQIIKHVIHSRRNLRSSSSPALHFKDKTIAELFISHVLQIVLGILQLTIYFNLPSLLDLYFPN